VGLYPQSSEKCKNICVLAHRYKSASVDRLAPSCCGCCTSGGMRRAMACISGENVFMRMKFEGGVHRVQRVPRTEKSGRVHTSTATVAVMARPDEVSTMFLDI
jgi:PCRF domain